VATGTALDKLNMMDADRAFSKMSEEKGMKNAFLEYIDSNGVLLRPNHLPIVGADAIDYLIQQNDSTFILKWEPRNGTVAHSGELGYTYGKYTWFSKDSTGKTSENKGIFHTVWKKQKDGTWRFVWD
jgi:ketosteroid isomerase-like protein